MSSEEQSKHGVHVSVDEDYPAYDSHEYDAIEKKALRKIDFWLVGFYSVVYIFRVIDSSNYSNAAILNLESGTDIKTELHFGPNAWAWTLSIFSYSYLIFEPSNTILLKRFRPSRWLFVLYVSCLKHMHQCNLLTAVLI